MKEIKDIKVVQRHLLEIAKAADKVLSSHDIPFVIAYGSLLGAVRHGGFIPWDDDMDFYIPYDKYQQAWEVLKSELPEPYEVVSFKTHHGCRCTFYKIHNKTTLLDDKGSNVPLEEKLGINIDLFPLVMNMDGANTNIKKVKRLINLHQKVYVRDVHKRWYISVFKSFLRFICPISERKLKEKIIVFGDKFGEGDDTFSYLANYYEKEVIPQKYIYPYRRIDFDGYNFLAPGNPDGYLRFYFGNYMQLPPECKRVWHADGVYEK